MQALKFFDKFIQKKKIKTSEVMNTGITFFFARILVLLSYEETGSGKMREFKHAKMVLGLKEARIGIVLKNTKLL